ncbi:MAG: PEGA domain-containing protein [Deltaproteobacteria bacterium]|nr:PEGA domain-containing protein [Deltaproteobacteria bacterium]
MRDRVVLVLLILVASATARANPEAARALDAGIDAFRLGKYAEARQLLDKARALAPRLAGPPRFLAAVAQAEQRWQDCIDHARIALELEPAGAQVTDTRKLHEQCRTGAGRAPYHTRAGAEDAAAIAVTANVAGATVKINGLTYGGTPLAPREITAGKPLALVVEKLGYRPAHAEVTALAGIATDVAVELVAAPEVDAPRGSGSARNPAVVAPRPTGCCTGAHDPSTSAAALFVFVILRRRRRS